jgi:phosphonoacetaldehyde hydrolase
MKHIPAVIFDWAGTVVDHGSRAPVVTIQAVFKMAGVPVTIEEARLSMGIAKRDHLASILTLARVREEWERVHGALPETSDVDRLYADFVPRQFACLEPNSKVITGVPEAMQRLREHGVKIGSTTGYTRPMLDLLVKLARDQGFSPDCALCPDDVPGGGRPAPWMCYKTAVLLKVAPLSAMVKIGDTPSDIEEGRNAGMWTIGITRTGNEVGLTAAEWEALPKAQQTAALDRAAIRFRHAGAHDIAESVGECFDALERIDNRIAAGERP